MSNRALYDYPRGDVHVGGKFNLIEAFKRHSVVLFLMFTINMRTLFDVLFCHLLANSSLRFGSFSLEAHANTYHHITYSKISVIYFDILSLKVQSRIV